MIRFFRRVSRKFSRRLIRIVDLASPSSRSKCSYEKRIRFLRALFSPSLPRASLIRRELTSDISCCKHELYSRHRHGEQRVDLELYRTCRVFHPTDTIARLVESNTSYLFGRRERTKNARAFITYSKKSFIEILFRSIKPEQRRYLRRLFCEKFSLP